MELRANQTVTVDPGLPPGDPGLLPAIPVPTAPPSGTVVPYRTVPPRIRLAWGAAVRADAYRLEIAREPRFHDLVDVEDALRANQFVHGNLASGVYYWRVSALAGHADGKPCPPQRLELVQDREAPALRVDFPEGPVEKGSLVLRGQAEPGAQVFIGNERISTDDSGRFEVPLNLEPGINIVVVEAMDAAGNATYRSGLLDAKDERVP